MKNMEDLNVREKHMIELENSIFSLYPYNKLSYTVTSKGHREVSSALNRLLHKYPANTIFENGEEPFFIFEVITLEEVLELLRTWR